MPHQTWLLLLAMLTVACQASTADSAVLPSASIAPPSPVPTARFNAELTRLADEFHALRALPSHFDGGEWHPDVDEWQGRKHQVMLALENELEREAYDHSRLTSLLGPPDHVVTVGDALAERIRRLPEYDAFERSDAFLVYQWRGTHDFLFFAMQDDQVVASGWWYAGE